MHSVFAVLNNVSTTSSPPQGLLWFYVFKYSYDFTNVLVHVKVFVTCDVFLILYIDVCHLDFRGSRWLSAPATTVLSSCACFWGQLHDRHWKHASHYLQHWEDGWGTALPHGILLCPAPHLPKVHFHTSVSTANRNSPRFHSWARFDPFLQKSHWLVEVLHWVSELLFFFCVCSCFPLSHVRLKKKNEVLFHKRFGCYPCLLVKFKSFLVQYCAITPAVTIVYAATIEDITFGFWWMFN